ncbi:unnamed protein product, partial [Didymodactylos carnosus]
TMGWSFPDLIIRKRIRLTDFFVALTAGIIGGVYTFRPGILEAKKEAEKREVLKEITIRREQEQLAKSGNVEVQNTTA